ncbi:hypothetical protein BCV70DRAFT_47810 [Testicularia cyperi]|uniref:Uncharacterized protein n=1 Tax=Testicularia cyperi TaxID=1882483 RepID=A0A317XGX8_9BASI|nr:hypothetical protein BCV70DRAFT_47810 [Testicularia cyperi]
MSDLLVPSPRSDLGPILIRKHLTNNRGMSEHLQLYEQRHGIPLRGKDLASIWTLPQFQGVQLYNHQYRDKYTSYMIGMGYVEPQYKAEVMNHLTTLIETKGMETALRP